MMYIPATHMSNNTVMMIIIILTEEDPLIPNSCTTVCNKWIIVNVNNESLHDLYTRQNIINAIY